MTKPKNVLLLEQPRVAPSASRPNRMRSLTKVHQSRARLSCHWHVDRDTGELVSVWSADEAQSECEQSWPIRIAA